MSDSPENSPKRSPKDSPQAFQAIFVYGLICACIAVLALLEGHLSFAIAYSILFWIGYGAAVVFGQIKMPRPRQLHQALYWAMWWPWFRKRHAKGPGDRS